jgi:hypothetical protein
MGPERELFWRSNAVSSVIFCTSNGISPTNELYDRSKNVRLEDSELGMIPDKLLC